MTVRELEKALSYYPHDLEVLIARDAEGNEFHLIDELGPDKDIEVAHHGPVDYAVIIWPF